MCITGPGSLGCREIIHASFKCDPQLIRKNCKKILKQCESKGYHSVAFPAINTGLYCVCVCVCVCVSECLRVLVHYGQYQICLNHLNVVRIVGLHLITYNNTWQQVIVKQLVKVEISNRSINL